jgi:hypothetical protein
MKTLVFLGFFLGGFFLAGCAPKEKPYNYDLTSVNVGKDDASGLELYFGDKWEGVGGLAANAKGSATHAFFETPIPYPTRIEFTPGDVTTDQRIVITDIKVEGELKRDVPDQTLTVEIDTTNKRAVCKVGVAAKLQP